MGILASRNIRFVPTAKKGIELVHVYRDEGISGRYDEIKKRPGFKTMLDAIDRHDADVVIVHTLDRWARNVLVTLTAFKTLGKANCAFVSLNEAIDYSTPEGKLFLIMLAAFAEYFSGALAKHSSKAKRARARAGLPLAHVGFGYRNHKGKAVLVEEEARALRENVFEPFLTNRYDHNALAQRMRDTNYMHGGRVGWLTAHGKVWKADTVRFILQNPFYAGWVVDHVTGERVRGQHTPIITDEMFERVQAIITERRGNRTPFASAVQSITLKKRPYE